MKGLILKDCINLKQQWKIYAILIVIWSAMSISDGSGSFFSGVISMLPFIIVLTSIAYDERSKWDAYALTMPISRKDVVKSKYFLGLIVYSISLVFSIIVNLFYTNSIKENITGNMTVSTIGLVFLAIIIPIIYKFGIEKARIVLMVVILVPAMFVPIFVTTMNVTDSKVQIESVFSYAPIILLVALGILYLSYLISMSLINKKEY